MTASEPARSLRAHVADLAALGRLHVVAKPVDREEVACIARWAAESRREGDAYALRFDRVADHAMPVVLGLFASRGFVARSLGVEPDGLWQRFARALDAPLAPQVVERGAAQEVELRGDAIDLTSWPIPIWTPDRDRAPYLSTACIVTTDRADGSANLGTYRVEVQGPRTLGLAFGSESQHGAMHRRTWEEAGEAMPVALVLGAAPAVSYAAAAKLRYGVDELGLAGGLLGAPVPVVRCRTSALLVPAEAEIVIEGFVRAGVREEEGPFGEALGYMEPGGPASVIDVACVTHRREPVLHGLIQQLPPSEGHVLMEVGLLGSLWHHLRGPARLPGLVDLGVLPGAAGVSIVVASVRAGDRDGARAVLRALGALSWGQKLAVVVDEDVDVRSAERVLWALSTRVDFARDLTVQADVPLYQWDPAAYRRAAESGDAGGDAVPSGDKVLIDATIKADCTAVALPGRERMERVRESWTATGLPPLGDVSALARLLRHAGPGLEHRLPREPR